PVAKTVHVLQEEEVPLADRANMVYMGTSVSVGKAKVLVAYTGMSTVLGKIAGMVQDISHELTPLQKKLEEFGKWIVYLCFALVALVFVLEWLRGGRLVDVFLTAVSLSVAAIPEGLPAVVTIALALGVNRMVKRNALIRKLPSVETLGCATVICSDKTGTLTKNEMTVRALYTASGLYEVTGIGYAPTGDYLLNKERVKLENSPGLTSALASAVLCNGAELTEKEGTFSIIGDPTEGALVTAAAKAGLSKTDLEKDFVFFDEIPFDSERKKMTVVRKTARGLVAFTKGAPDILIKDCTAIEKDGKIYPMTEADRSEIYAANDRLSSRAMRVLALASKEVKEGSYDPDNPEGVEANLAFLGLIAMIDPPREEVRAAIKECKTAGIRA
ncbi:MAG TPA: HAD-IC family P-type ATPase, partial [Candidatus Omnitrophota bacterium]|nr:HAD-IC family P-type ATPase [Candidatus Omnitrophota bacterium]